MMISTDDLIARELTAGERLLWSGRSRSPRLLQSHDAVALWLAVFAGFLAFAAVSSVLSSGFPFGALVAVVPFVVLAVVVVVGNPALVAGLRGQIVYGLTDRRIIIATGGRAPRATSLPLRTLQAITLAEQPDGSGTIGFGLPLAPFGGWLNLGAGQEREALLTPALTRIDDARRVHELILRAQSALATTPGATGF